MQQMIKRILVLLTIILNLPSFGQSSGKRVMTSFIPKSKAYDIYYPKSFSLKEDQEGIVMISDSVSKLNITVSSFFTVKGMDDKKLIEQLNAFIKDYYKKELNEEDWKSYKTKFEILVETAFSVDQTNWIWYGIVDKQRLVTITINKDTAIGQEEINLIRFMLNNLIING